MIQVQPRKILVVDNSPESADATKAVLQRRNHQVFSAADGMAGWELALQEVPEVVITDLRVPRLSGFELAARLRLGTQFEQSVLIAVSALNDAANLARVRAAGFDYFAKKPVAPDALIRGAEAQRQNTLMLLSQSLLERSRDLQSRCETLSQKSRLVNEANAALIAGFSSAFFLAPPQRLSAAVSQYAGKTGGFRRICYVVMDFTRGRVEQVDQHFQKQSDARRYARRFGVHGYFYPLYERKVPTREFFPSAAQIFNYLTKGGFEQ